MLRRGCSGGSAYEGVLLSSNCDVTIRRYFTQLYVVGLSVYFKVYRQSHYKQLKNPLIVTVPQTDTWMSLLADPCEPLITVDLDLTRLRS